MRSGNKLILPVLVIVLSFWGISQCTRTGAEAGDTLIILDPFSCAGEDGCTLVSEVNSLIKAEIGKKFQRNRKSHERIFIYFGGAEQDTLLITLPKDLRKLSNFAKFDKMFERFADSCSKALNDKICDHPDEQSAVFGVFGDYYLLKNYNAKIGKIIFAGNLVEKSFHNLVIKIDELHESKESQNIEAKINQAFEDFHKKFDATFSARGEGETAGKKTDIELYISRRRLDRLVYMERHHYKTYIELVKEFFKDYDQDGKIVVLNEY